MYQTQKQLILEYLEEHGSILPAKIGGTVYKGVMFGSETSKRCRELRKSGYLMSEKEGKFERFRFPMQKEIQFYQLPKTESLFPVDQLNIRA